MPEGTPSGPPGTVTAQAGDCSVSLAPCGVPQSDRHQWWIITVVRSGCSFPATTEFSASVVSGMMRVVFPRQGVIMAMWLLPLPVCTPDEALDAAMNHAFLAEMSSQPA